MKLDHQRNSPSSNQVDIARFTASFSVSASSLCHGRRSTERTDRGKSVDDGWIGLRADVSAMIRCITDEFNMIDIGYFKRFRYGGLWHQQAFAFPVIRKFEIDEYYWNVRLQSNPCAINRSTLSDIFTPRGQAILIVSVVAMAVVAFLYERIVFSCSSH